MPPPAATESTGWSCSTGSPSRWLPAPAARLPLRIAHRNPHQKPVQLALRQGVGSLELERVLRGDDHERLRQGVGHAVHGDLALAHGLQQRTLGPRRGPVDLVGQHHVGEHRPLFVLEFGRFRVEQAAADDVAGQQVRRELQAAEIAGQARARALPTNVLPTPGTSSSSTCSPANSATRHIRTTSGLPSTTLRMFRCSSAIASRRSLDMNSLESLEQSDRKSLD